jgi:hypothetical protein
MSRAMELGRAHSRHDRGSRQGQDNSSNNDNDQRYIYSKHCGGGVIAGHVTYCTFLRILIPLYTVVVVQYMCTEQ